MAEGREEGREKGREEGYNPNSQLSRNHFCGIKRVIRCFVLFVHQLCKLMVALSKPFFQSDAKIFI